MNIKKDQTMDVDQKMRFIKFTVFVLFIEVIAVIVSAVIMLIGIIRPDIMIFYSSMKATFLVLILVLFSEIVPLLSIMKMLSEFSNNHK